MSARERILWIDTAAGASGDMILAALVYAGAPIGAVRKAVAALKLPGVRIASSRVMRCGVAAARVEVRVAGSHEDDHHVLGPKSHRPDHAHHGRTLRAIRGVIAGGRLPSPVRDRALVVFRRLFEAEARAHGAKPEAIHLHEAGAADAIADVVGCCAALHALAPDRIVVSPVTTGSGTVRCAHGVYPVPGPATSVLLAGCPLSGIEADGERLTPTGAAILTSIAHAWGGLPAMTLEAIGVGAGARDPAERPNVVRALLGAGPAEVRPAGADGNARPEIVVLELAVDDATPQLIAHAGERLREAGALDVHVTPVLMKKGRPGHLVTVLARPDAVEALSRIALTETTTLGLRIRREERIELAREERTVPTPYGPIRVKSGWLDGKRVHAWPEHEDCAAAARKHRVPLLAVQQAALGAASPGRRRTR